MVPVSKVSAASGQEQKEPATPGLIKQTLTNLLTHVHIILHTSQFHLISCNILPEKTFFSLNFLCIKSICIQIGSIFVKVHNSKHYMRLILTNSFLFKP